MFMIKRSIRNRLIVILLTITIIPFGTSIVITYYYTKESIKDQYIEENVNLLYQGKLNLEGYIDELKDLTVSFYNNPDFVKYLRAGGKDQSYLTLDLIKDVMVTLLYAENNINRVTITFPENENEVYHYVSVSKQSTLTFSSTNQLPYEYYFEKAANNRYFLTIEPMHRQPGDRNDNVITFHRALIDAPQLTKLGYISIDILPDQIFELSENLYHKDTEQFHIISPEGNRIYSSNSQSIQEMDWYMQILDAEDDAGTLDWNNDTYQGIIIYQKLPESAGGWMLVKQIPYLSLYESALSVAKINILFGIIGLVLVILATFFVSFRITYPIRVLLQNIRQVEKGNMEVQFESLGQDEIGMLGHRFKKMMHRINQLINREYKLELENKTNQLKVLQSQLNPHFLNNALQSIGTLALKNNLIQIYTLVTHLSEIMRYGMNIDEDMVPLVKERDYIQAYLLLQKERFGESLLYSLEFDENILNMNIPKMLLQPIVENYFKHGFDIRDDVGVIIIKGAIEANKLVIRIQDNGIGISKQKRNDIYASIQDERTQGEGSNIGLKNVYHRMKLYYGQQANLQLENHVDGGLVVTIQLPVEMEGELNEGNYH